MACVGSSCSCNQGEALSVTTYYGEAPTGGCYWGDGNPDNPVPEGECFCLYDVATKAVETVYRCN